MNLKFITQTGALIILLFSTLLCAAQQPVPVPITSPNGSSCGNDALLRQLRQDPDYVAREEAFNESILNQYRNLSNDPVTLPVVVHIVRDDPFNVTDLDVINGIQDLNYAYSKSGPYSASMGVDSRIQFCLAQTDPLGGITNGITRTVSDLGQELCMETEDSRLKSLVVWDPAHYINIWLVNSVEGEAYYSFVCGQLIRLRAGAYATLPPGGGNTDGIVVPTFGETLAHEMGHYLGLYHTFEGGCFNDNCLFNGDRVCDTPPDNNVLSAPSCSSPGNSCQTDTLSNYSNGFFPIDVPDQISNFMDYGNGGCHNEFTQGQSDRMHATILGPRSGLLDDRCTPPCGENILANFIRDISDPRVGDNIHFTNTSTGATNYEWILNGSVVATTADYNFTTTGLGSDTIVLKAYNSPGCYATYSDIVFTRCGPRARFWGDKVIIASLTNVYEDSIAFTNTSINSSIYSWQVSTDNGITWTEVSTSVNLTYVFPHPGDWLVRLIASNGTCSDTSGSYHVPVSDPTADGSPFSMKISCYNNNKIKVSFCLVDWGIAPLPANSLITFYDGNPALPTSHLLSPIMHLPYNVPGGNCYMCFDHILNVNYVNVSEVWMVFNDSGHVVPIHLPNTTFPEKLYDNNISYVNTSRTTENASICQGSSYGGYTQTGTYIDTLFSLVNGCDSIRTLHLTVKPVPHTTINASICQGENYAGHTSSGTFTDTYNAANGCDSIRTLHLTVKPVPHTNVSISICQGENYAGHNSSGTYTDTYNAANGCDSTRTLYLTVKPLSFTVIDTAMCQGESYQGYSTTGTFTDVFTAANGCDSTRTLNLTIKPKKYRTINATICQGENYEGYSQAGTYINVFTASNGCDSTRTLNLTVNQLSYKTVTTSICDGENYAGHTQTGMYVDTYTAANGCDSIRTLYLTVKPNSSSTVSVILCEGENYSGHTQTGTYTDIFPSANGCDSTRTLNLLVNPKQITHLYPEICKGQSYFASGHQQNTSGIYYDTLNTYLGCDSVIITHLHVRDLPKPDLGPMRGICTHDTIRLDPGSFSSFLWQDGSTNQFFDVYFPGLYFVYVTDDIGCAGSDSVNIPKMYPLPNDFLPADTSLCLGNTVILKPREFISYLWSTGATTRSIAVNQTGTYRLEVTDFYGCKGTDSTHVFFYTDCLDIQIPNAFTPNDDQLNDHFRPFVPAPIMDFQMQIWDRWGKLLYATNDYTRGWDGTFKGIEQPTAAYIYVIRYKTRDGKPFKKKGSFLLIR